LTLHARPLACHTDSLAFVIGVTKRDQDL